MKVILKVLRFVLYLGLAVLLLIFVMIAADSQLPGSMRFFGIVLILLDVSCIAWLYMVSHKPKEAPGKKPTVKRDLPVYAVPAQLEKKPTVQQARAERPFNAIRCSVRRMDPLQLARADGTPASFVAFDLETTGLQPSQDKIVEIGAVIVRDGQIGQQFQTLVNPGIPMPAAASAVNHITDAMLADAPTIGGVLPAFLRFIGDLPLVAHNAGFDADFLAYAAGSMSLTFSNPVADSLALSRSCWPRLDHYKLGDVCEKIHYVNQDAHRALADAMAVAAIVNAAGIERTAYAKYGKAYSKHWDLLYEIRDKYKDANKDGAAPEAMDVVIALCRQDIALADQVVAYCKATGREPYFESFKTLVRVLQQHGEHAEAVRVCDQAIALGLNDDRTKGGMEARRQKSVTQLEKTSHVRRRRGENNGNS